MSLFTEEFFRFHIQALHQPRFDQRLAGDAPPSGGVVQRADSPLRQIDIEPAHDWLHTPRRICVQVLTNVLAFVESTVKFSGR